MSGLTPISSADLAGVNSADLFFAEGAYIGIVAYVHGVTGGEALHVEARFSVNGSSFRTDSTGYSYSGRFYDGAGDTNLNNNSNAFRIANAFGANGLECVSGILNVWDNGADNICGTSYFTGLDASGSSRTVGNGCDLGVAGPLRGVQVLKNGGGNFTKGKVDWYGWVAP